MALLVDIRLDGGIKESNPALLQALAVDRAFNDGAAAGLEIKAAMVCVCRLTPPSSV